MTLGIARAQRDQACVYTVGFYDEPEEDRSRSIVVRVLREGVRAHHPSAYVFRSPAAKRTTRLRAAYALPDAFDSGVVGARILPLRPQDADHWDALLVVSFPVPLGELDGKLAIRDFGAVLTRQRTIAHRFDRRVTLTPESAATRSSPTVTFVDRVALRPGRYELTVVMTDPDSIDPHAHRLQVELPQVPKKKIFLTQPILGRPAGADLVITGDSRPDGDHVGSENSFRPLVDTELDAPTDLVALTSACLVGSGSVPDGEILRTVRNDSGQAAGELAPVPLEIAAVERRAKIRCQKIVDVLPGAALTDGEWAYEATIETSADEGLEPDPAAIRFTVAEAPAATVTPGDAGNSRREGR